MPERIFIFINTLSSGGAARVAVNLAGEWTDMGRTVTILCSDRGLRPPVFPLPPGVRCLHLDLRGDSHGLLDAAFRNVWRLRRLRRVIETEAPDLLLSFLDRNNVLSVLATRALPRRVPVIISERTDPHGRSIGTLWGVLRRLTYPWADCLVVQTDHALAFFTGRARAKGRVIPNPVFPTEAVEPVPVRARNRVVTLGRLDWVKGHDLLIEAFARLAPEHPDWDLAIHGDGPEQPALQERIRALGLVDRICLAGSRTDVAACLAEADLFVLSSRVEGFPNALAEAMAAGLPVVSFDCASGPSELIRDGLDGILVPPGDVVALGAAMGRLMADPGERSRLASRAPEVLTRFSPTRIMELWEAALAAARMSA